MNSDTIPTKHGYLIIGEPLPKYFTEQFKF